MSSIHTAPIEDQIRYVLFKLAEAGDAGVPVSGGYLPRDGAREVMRQKLGEAERGILYILPKGHKWMRRNASEGSSMNREKVARELVKLAKELTAEVDSKLKSKWRNMADDLTNAIAIHARKQGNKKVLSRVDAVSKDLKKLIGEL